MIREFQLWPQKLQEGLDLAHNFHFEHGTLLPKGIKKIAFFGMGGSGIAGRIIKTILDKKCSIPSFVVDSPELPAFIDTDTFAVVVSYSGNTWETVAALEKLVEKFVPTLVIAHGGKALEIAEGKNIPHIVVPQSETPRTALGYFLSIILGLFDLMGITTTGKEIIASCIEHAERYIPKFEDKGHFIDFLDMAEGHDWFHVWGIQGDSAPCAYRAQTQFNENSKVQAVTSFFPELNHNLLTSFTLNKEKSLVVMVYTDFLPAQTCIAIDAMSEILHEQGIMLYKQPVLGDTWEKQLFYLILWADFASYYLAEKRGVDAKAIPLIDALKERIEEKRL
jgi:glucose/mannose-6-phosphate isomerase